MIRTISYSLVTIEPLLDLLTSSAINEIWVAIESDDYMPDWLLETIQSYQHKLFKENGIEEEFFQVNLENKQIKNNVKFFDFVKAIVEINDFGFIVFNPKKELPNYFRNGKVMVDTKKWWELYHFWLWCLRGVYPMLMKEIFCRQRIT